MYFVSFGLSPRVGAAPPRAAAMLDRKTGLNNPSAALSAGYFSDFAKPFDPVVRRSTALEPKHLRKAPPSVAVALT
jgi:hypothetical protein